MLWFFQVIVFGMPVALRHISVVRGSQPLTTIKILSAAVTVPGYMEVVGGLTAVTTVT